MGGTTDYNFYGLFLFALLGSTFVRTAFPVNRHELRVKAQRRLDDTAIHCSARTRLENCNCVPLVGTQI